MKGLLQGRHGGGKVGMAEASAATTIYDGIDGHRSIVVAALASAMLVDMVFPTLQQP